MKTQTWQDQDIIVFGARKKLATVYGGKLYHGSPALLPVGTVLEPQPTRNFPESPKNSICFTSDPLTAVYWARKAVNDMNAEVYVYEVNPLSPVTCHRVMPTNYGQNIQLQEGRSDTATITEIHHIPQGAKPTQLKPLFLEN